jgi:hypothetical protein
MGCTHHHGLAVYGSGFCIGSNSNISGLFGAAGSDRTGAKDSFVGPAGVDGLIRFDAGTTSFSGYTSVSTRLSSVAMVVANFKGLIKVSGQAEVMTNWSGHVIDLTLKDGFAGASASGAIAWLAVGK